MFRRSRRDDRSPDAAGGDDLESLLAAALRELDAEGEVSLDLDGPALVMGDGRAELAKVLGQVEGKPVERRQATVRAAAERLLRTHRPLPAQYAAVAPELWPDLNQHRLQAAKYPDSPVPDEQIGRIERAYDIPGWQERLRRAGARYEAMFRDKDHVGSLLSAASMRSLAGDQDEARALANEVVDRLDADGPGAWESTSVNPQVGQRCAALTLAADRAGLATMGETTSTTELGPTWAVMCRAAAAAERGDPRAVEEELGPWRKVAAKSPLDSSGAAPSERDLLEVLESWANG